MKSKKRLIVSAVNFSEGGPLTVLIESLDAAVACLDPEWEIIALVHDTALFKNSRVKTIAFPKSKRSWLNRLALEWWHFNALSKQLKPDLWLSLHDITPRVHARRQVAYCHNPSPFYRINISEALLEPRFALFNAFYKYLYRFFIHRNYAVVVQQQWLRSEFREIFNLPHIIVAHPTTQNDIAALPNAGTCGKAVFLYPALPRVFKNIEVLCQAVASLPPSVRSSIEVRLTVSGSENRYAQYLFKRFSNIEGISFIGRQTREQMLLHYAQCDAVVFPSKLETWGLPITEAKAWGKPLLVADLPYAHETVGSYDRASFLPPNDIAAWASALQAVTIGSWRYLGSAGSPPDAPFASDWIDLWKLLTEGL